MAQGTTYEGCGGLFQKAHFSVPSKTHHVLRGSTCFRLTHWVVGVVHETEEVTVDTCSGDQEE